MNRPLSSHRIFWRVTALLVSFILVFSLIPPQSGAAPSAFFAAVDYDILPLYPQYMPLNFSGTLYAPTRVFTHGTDLHVSYTANLDYVTIYNAEKTLVFNLAQGVSFDNDQVYSAKARKIDEYYFLPVDFVCTYFGRTFTQMDTDYGPLLRLHYTSNSNSDRLFLSSAGDVLRSFHRDFQAQYLVSPTPSARPSTPGSTPQVIVPPSTPPSTEPRRKIAYLTFDDGPNKESTDALLDLLDEYDVKATFFLLGVNFHKNEDAIRRIVGSGHGVGLHSYTHRREVFYSNAETMIEELNRANALLADITMQKTRIVRVPYGSVPHLTPELSQAMTDAGFRYWDWNIDSGDSYRSTTSAKVASETIRFLKEMKGPAVVLFHDSTLTLEAMPAVLDYMKAENYVFRVITENEMPQNYQKWVK